ncbi:transposase family protein [Eubacteriales bacterium OttesenSCG-928-N13]|nr:transposase family protein [Eubacteriales bacterium OttesenSCG-928-N13]
MVGNFSAMMAGSLGLEEPWHIERAAFDAEELAVRIYVSVRRRAALAGPSAGAKQNATATKNERVCRHGDMLFHPCYIHARRPKVLCSKCGSKQVNAPFERRNSRFTLLLEGYAMMILADMPVSKTVAVLRCDEKSLVIRIST